VSREHGAQMGFVIQIIDATLSWNGTTRELEGDAL
jgi:hypothetical protein